MEYGKMDNVIRNMLVVVRNDFSELRGEVTVLLQKALHDKPLAKMVISVLCNSSRISNQAKRELATIDTEVSSVKEIARSIITILINYGSNAQSKIELMALGALIVDDETPKEEKEGPEVKKILAEELNVENVSIESPVIKSNDRRLHK